MSRTDKREIQERLTMWDDLMEKDPKMRKIRKESEAKGRTEGLKEGMEKGIREGLAEGLRKAIITAIRLRFPDLTEVAQEKVARVSKPEKLDLLVDQIAIAPDEKMVLLLLDLAA